MRALREAKPFNPNTSPKRSRTAHLSQTLICWRKEYGGLRIDQAKRFKGLEKENTRLKRLVADLSLDNAILKDVASGNL